MYNWTLTVQTHGVKHQLYIIFPRNGFPLYSATTHNLMLVHLQVDLHSFNVFVIQHPVNKYLSAYFVLDVAPEKMGNSSE